MAYDGAQRPGEIAAVFNAALTAFEDDRRCFQVTRVLGSMLVFDFGLPGRRPTSGGSTVLVGTGVLSIGNAYWWISGSKHRLNSEALDDRLFSMLQQTFLSEQLRAVEANAGALKFVFSGSASLNVDLTNVWGQESDDEVCVLEVDGLSVTLSPNRQVRLRRDRDNQKVA